MFNGHRFSVWEDEKILEMDNDDGCIATHNVLNVKEMNN